MVVRAYTIGCWRLHITESTWVAEAKRFSISNTVKNNGSFRVDDSCVLIAIGLLVAVITLIVSTVGGDHGFTCGLRRY